MRFRAALLPLLPLAPLAALGCAPPPRLAETAPTIIHIDPAEAKSDPSVTGARFVPIETPANASFGVEPGGGARSIAAGVRMVSLPGGGVVTAMERLPGASWTVVALPERLGGGFLFRIDERSLWRAEKWLGPARPIYVVSAGTTIARVVPGLDRVYLLTRGWRAIDGATGDPRPLGPWPPSPTIGAYAAADGWRALAIADLRGVVATSDAGATWRTLALPMDARSLSVKGDSLEVSGIELGHGEVSYEVRPDGQVARVAKWSHTAADPTEPTEVEPAGPLGAHPLEAAVDDGWPLGDGTAVVARDGALSRVRLDDGAVVETATGAFPLRPSRCHPLPIGKSGGFGFVCGEPRGATVLYTLDATASRGAMTELRRFDVPRAVLASGNGAIVVRGPCDARAPGDGEPGAHHYCVRTVDGAWSETRVEGAVGDERVTSLADGRLAILSPPKGNLDTGRLTLVDKGHAASIPIAFSPEGSARPGAARSGADTAADLARVLALGVWLDGVEERRPGVLGGWIEASGTMLGFELTLDGKARTGTLVRGEHSLPMVSGRYGLGWGGAHGGYETTDGGMTWSPVPVPDPIRPLRAIASRACGPIGCSAAGWLRIGWGAGETEPQRPSPQPASLRPRSYLALALDCEPGDVAAHPSSAREPRVDLLGAPPSPALAADARVVVLDTLDMHGTGPAGRMYGWGPKSGDWGPATKWMMRWVWPFGGAADVRSSAAVAAPPLLLEALSASSGPFFLGGWRVALGDEPSHALLLTPRRPGRPDAVFELEADRAPVEIRRASGDLLGEVESEVRAAERWYVATIAPPSTNTSGRTETIVWQIDGPVAHELARIPRAAGVGRVGTGQLALRADGAAIGYVVDGQPPPDRSEATRWVVPIDLDSGSLGEIEPLGAVDFGDRAAVSPCTRDDVGWSIDLPLDSFPISLASSGGATATLHGVFGRVRIGRSRVCVERLAGTSGQPNDVLGQRSPPSTASATGSITVTVGDRRERRVLRCGVR